MLGERTLRQKIINHVVLCLLSFFMIFPVFWWFFASFKPMTELALPGILPQTWTLENYREGWKVAAGLTFGKFFLNTLLICTINVVGAVISEWLGGFGGLGVYMTRVKKAFAFDRMFAVIFLTSAVSLALMALVAFAEKKCMPYKALDKNNRED